MVEGGEAEEGMGDEGEGGWWSKRNRRYAPQHCVSPIDLVRKEKGKARIAS